MADSVFSAFIWMLIQTVTGMGRLATSQSMVISPAMKAGITNIMNVGIKPFASILLSLFATLELFNVSTRADSFGLSGNSSARVEMLGLTLAKIGILVYFVQRIDTFVWGIYEFGNSIMNKISVNSNTLSPAGISFGQVNEMVGQLETGIFDKVLAYVGLIPAMVIVEICVVIVFVIYTVRIIEIFTLIALSPIPFSTLIHSEYSQIGKNYIKSFGAVVLQGAVIMVVLSVYGLLMRGAVLDSSSLTAIAWSCVKYAILLVVSLAGTGALSKRILNAQ